MSPAILYILSAILPGTGGAILASQIGDSGLLKRSFWQMAIYWAGVLVACSASRAVGLPLVGAAVAWALYEVHKALSAL